MSPIPRTIKCLIAFVIIAASTSAADHGIEPEQRPSLRWSGGEINVESLASLAGRDWDTITLFEAKLDGTVIEPLRHARSIRSLRLQGTGLSGQIGRLKNVNGLTGLEIGGTNLTALDLEQIGLLTDLEHLSLPGDLTINVSGAREIAKLTKLKSLRLYLVNLDDASFAELKPLVQLEKLDLSHTRVTDDGLRIVEGMPLLKELHLIRHPDWLVKPQLTNACVPSLMRLKELRYLSLSGSLSDKGFAFLARLPNLKSINIYGTEITSEGLSALENSTIESITLSSSQMGIGGLYRGAVHLKNCRTLKSVTVIGKFLSEQVMTDLQMLLPEIGLGFQG